MKNRARKLSVITFSSVVVVLMLLGFYNQSQQNLNRQVEQEVARKNHLAKYFRGIKFTYQSTVNGIKRNGIEVKSSSTVSMHVFDFSDMTVTTSSLLNGKLHKTIHDITDYSKDRGSVSIHTLKIENLGLKEIRFNPKMHTIEYYYYNGTVSVYKNITREMSYDLVSPNLQAN